MFQENPVIEDINLMCNEIGKEGAEILAKALHVSFPTNCIVSSQYTWIS